MKKKQLSRLLALGGISIIAAALIFAVVVQVGVANNTAFIQSVDSIANDAISLTHNYQAEEAKWRTKQYDNATMAGIIEKFGPQYQAIIDRAKGLNAPEKFKPAVDFLIKAVQSEKDSNEHFRSALLTNDRAEYAKSLSLLSQSYGYSGDYDAAMKAAGA